jgi:hypothetical protein
MQPDSRPRPATPLRSHDQPRPAAAMTSHGHLRPWPATAMPTTAPGQPPPMRTPTPIVAEGAIRATHGHRLRHPAPTATPTMHTPVPRRAATRSGQSDVGSRGPSTAATSMSAPATKTSRGTKQPRPPSSHRRRGEGPHRRLPCGPRVLKATHSGGGTAMDVGIWDAAARVSGSARRPRGRRELLTCKTSWLMLVNLCLASRLVLLLLSMNRWNNDMMRSMP